MADLGFILTDKEVEALPSWTQGGHAAWSTLESFLLRGVEAMIQQNINMAIGKVTYTREPYTIEPPIRRDNVVTHPRDMFFLKHSPVLNFTGVEIVSQRNTDGSVQAVTLLPPNSYEVNKSAGILRLYYSIPLDPSIWPYPLALDPNNLWPFGGSFPPGVGNLLVTYDAGFQDLSAIPFDLKLVALASLTRAKKKFTNNDFDVSSVAMQGMSTATFIDAQFTKYEQAILANYRRGYFPDYH